MNVIFLDFDGVIDTYHFYENEDVEKKIEILSRMCKKLNCKVVIEASAKDGIDKESLEPLSEWTKFIFSMFDKYNIECIGITPSVGKRISKYSYTPIWKEDEIRLYLFRHPEIEHYCIIDDDDLAPRNSDLNKVRDHLVQTILYSDNKEEEGLLDKHIVEVEEVLKKENNIRKLLLKRSNIWKEKNHVE